MSYTATVRNAQSETVNIRFVYDSDEDVTRIQRLAGGDWLNTSLTIAGGSLNVGADVTVSAAYDVVQYLSNAADSSRRWSISQFFDDDGSQPPETYNISQKFFNFGSPTDGGEFTGTEFSYTVGGPPFDVSASNFHFRTGSTAATQPVRIQAWRGTDETGFKSVDLVFDASDFAANTDNDLEISPVLYVATGASTFIKLTSTADFSLITDPTVTTPYVTADDWFLQREQVLPHPSGTDRILTTIGSELILDQFGNVVISDSWVNFNPFG